MSYSKVIPLGSMGNMTISESNGDGKLSIGISESAGGGAISGVAKVSANIEAEVSALMLVDAGLGLLGVKFPSFAVEIAALKALVDSEIAKA